MAAAPLSRMSLFDRMSVRIIVMLLYKPNVIKHTVSSFIYLFDKLMASGKDS